MIEIQLDVGKFYYSFENSSYEASLENQLKDIEFRVIVDNIKFVYYEFIFKNAFSSAKQSGITCVFSVNRIPIEENGFRTNDILLDDEEVVNLFKEELNKEFKRLSKSVDIFNVLDSTRDYEMSFVEGEVRVSSKKVKELKPIRCL